MSRVLLVGANGFIGRTVSEELEIEHQIVRASHNSRNGVVQLDATNYEQTLDIITQCKPEIIVNCAGIVENSEKAAENVTMSMNLLRAAVDSGLKLKRFIVTGSAAEFGNVGSLPVNEDTPIEPVGLYGKYKAQESQQALKYGVDNDINVVTVRIFNPLGVGMHQRFLVSSLLRQIDEIKASKREAIEVHRLDSLRDYIDVRDIASAFSYIVSAQKLLHTSYNVGSGNITSNEKLIKTLLSIVDMPKVQMIESSNEPEKPVASQADTTRIRDEFGWSPHYNLKSTLMEIVNHV